MKEASDFFAWLSAVAGIVGALVLVRPLFLLLSRREAVDDMGYGIGYDLLSPALTSRIKEARKGFAEKLHEQRFAWKGWVVAGTNRARVIAGLRYRSRSAFIPVCAN